MTTTRSKADSRPILDQHAIEERFHSLQNDQINTSQDRGYEFEHLIYCLLSNAKLDPRSSYKRKGEQIDGSFFWQGQTFLLEAKWVRDPLPVSSIYMFKGKLDGKFHTTSGIFIAVNGFSPDVEDALRMGKSIKILLFDENDVRQLFTGEVDFLEMLRFKLRAAGDTGSVKVPYQLDKKAKQISNDLKEFLNVDQFIEKIGLRAVPQTKNVAQDLLVFVEGQSDIPAVTRLLENIKSKYFLTYQIYSLNGANNVRELPALLSLHGAYGQTRGVIVVLDNDEMANSIRPVIENVKAQILSSSIPVKTCILFLDKPFKDKLINRLLPAADIQRESVFETLEAFIQNIADEYYDPVYITPLEVLKGRLENLKWNFHEQEIEAEDEYYDLPIFLRSIEELVNYLNDEMISAMYAEMPLEWLKEHELEYDDEIKEYLDENYKEQITRMGWEI